MRKFLFLLLIAGCGAPNRDATNRWADEKIWPVLEAQEHRDTDALCALLRSVSPDVREAAALAFASVQDSLGVPCLLEALRDDAADVRAASASALTWVADTVVVRALNAAFEAEVDSAARIVMLHAAFRAVINAQEHDAMWLISCLESDDAVIRLLAASKVARLANENLMGSTYSLMHAVDTERDPTVRMFLVGALKHDTTATAIDKLRSLAAMDSLPMIRASSLRALGGSVNGILAVDLQKGLRDTCVGVRQIALESVRPPLIMAGDSIISLANRNTDIMVRAGLLGLAVQQNTPGARAHLERLLRKAKDPYITATIIKSMSPEKVNLDSIAGQLLLDQHPAIKQVLLAILLKGAPFSDELFDYTRVPRLWPAVQAVWQSRDPGLVAALCEHLLKTGDGGCSVSDLMVLVRQDTVDRIMQSLHPIRDLEARALLGQVLAKRDGLPPPAHERPAFNHPINKERLLALKQGQRYRIVTTKGDIIIATDVNECPGSSLAFDSLVVAGYYNSKAFHRMVPNFVVQGGCPRGDGYGGMPWTLRTEIGRTPFTAGSVGLASAGPDTESCQFFITHSATPHLDGRYTRFGEVVSGMDVVWELQVGDVMQRVERTE